MGHSLVLRNENNPLLTVDDVKASRDGFRVIGVFNAAVTKYEDNYLLLLRVAEQPVQESEEQFRCPVFNERLGRIGLKELDRRNGSYDFSDPRVVKGRGSETYLTSISHLRLAESADGVHFTVSDVPLIEACDKYSAFGVEDARITKIGDTYYINFSAASDNGIVVGLWSTANFKEFQKMGYIFHPDNKDVVLFPERIGGLYYALHRPSGSEYATPNIWIASSPDFIHWGDHRVVAKTRPGSWESERIGAGIVPIRTEKGWLEIYHGADDHNRYCLGVMLLDLEKPWKVISRYEQPLIEPEEPYETDGFFGNVVFSCGAVSENGVVHIYYGASDESMCLADVKLEELLRVL